MWNQSFDAAFMVPMAVSLGFGVLFATLITLILVPTSYMILDDLGRAMRGMLGDVSRRKPRCGAGPSGRGAPPASLRLPPEAERLRTPRRIASDRLGGLDAGPGKGCDLPTRVPMYARIGTLL